MRVSGTGTTPEICLDNVVYRIAFVSRHVEANSYTIAADIDSAWLRIFSTLPMPLTQ